ncbi:hypothetical protein JAAARDRAFT_187663 [Jaapia argillacea MUCL 33604]|uniref:DUF659 domain-containing protein n=1 Tax=Jaapia argillacea MUCL 33604 TaxID=933084 RepID=A0A067QBG0_9AGAM|nr:hypothetical protein JAAARDRAFT_187663 [Jaapia argillacea MUCL 33604]
MSGRPKSWIWNYFTQGTHLYKSDHSHKESWCNRCLQEEVLSLGREDEINLLAGIISEVRLEPAREEIARSSVPSMAGKKSSMIVHIKKCCHVDQTVKDHIRDLIAQDKENQNLPASAPQPPGPAASRTDSPSTQLPGRVVQPLRTAQTWPLEGPSRNVEVWTGEQQEEFNKDLCQTFAMRYFLKKYCPGVLVPDRRVVSGRVLACVVHEVEERNKAKTLGKLGAAMNDGFKTIAKDNVATTSMIVEGRAYLIRTHEISPEEKTGDAMLEIIEADITFIEKEYGVKIISWCTDEGPDGKKARRLLGAKRPDLVVPPCWAHQINLIVGEYLKLKIAFVETGADALEVIKWFNSHGKALSILNAEQASIPPNKVLALLLPAPTRWTTHYLAFDRLDEVANAVKSSVIKHTPRLVVAAGERADLKAKATEIIDIVSDYTFWGDLSQLGLDLEPLAVSTHVLEGDDTRLDHVLLTLGNLYRIFIDHAIEEKTELDLVAIWSDFDTTPEDTNGRAGLVKLAIRILSIVPNAAPVERNFSDFGLIQTPQRSQLDPQTVHQTSVVRQDLKRKYEDAGLFPQCKKRNLGRHSDEEIPGTDTINFRGIATFLMDSASGDDSEDEGGGVERAPGLSGVPQSRLYRERESFTLANMFEYSNTQDLGFYWSSDKQQLRDDLQGDA